MACPHHSTYCTSAQGAFDPNKWLASTGQVGHLFDSLTYLLQATQEWQLQNDITLNSTGYQAQIYSMDSAFLRARALFEFFTKQGRQYCHAKCLFNLPNQLQGPANIGRWMNQLHIGAMHLQNRHTGRQLPGYGGTAAKDLNMMPIDIARGVLEVWVKFEQALMAQGYTALHNKATACQKRAREDARQVVKNVHLRSKAYSGLPTADKLTMLF